MNMKDYRVIEEFLSSIVRLNIAKLDDKFFLIYICGFHADSYTIATYFRTNESRIDERRNQEIGILSAPR